MTNIHVENSISDMKALFYFCVVTFIYALSAGLFIQLYVIPVLFPHFNFGDGLAIMDSVGFDKIAREKAIEISREGWRAWELRPQLQSPAGIASFFYTHWTPKPYSLLPFNAIVHALSGCLIVWLLRHFYSLLPAIVGGAVFVLNPAAMEWVAQIHRDGVFILGNLMVLACLFQLSKSLYYFKASSVMWGLFFGLSGTIVVWVARGFWIQVLFSSILLWVGLLVLLCAYIDISVDED